MKTTESKKLLWKNVSALMLHHWKDINVTRLATEAGIGGSASRIKKQQTSVGLEVLDKIAPLFKLQAWHLLLPDLDPANPPVAMLSEDERKLYAKLRKAKEAFIE